MEFKTANREWVKNAAIIFLAVLLVLTFFSNTIMNRSLVEVATARVTDGNIVAKVRGTGTVTASGKHQVKATKTRTVRSVMVKAGQEVQTGDVLFILGEGDGDELEQAEQTLREYIQGKILETYRKRRCLCRPLTTLRRTAPCPMRKKRSTPQMKNASKHRSCTTICLKSTAIRR